MSESNTNESQIRSLPILIGYLCLAASLALNACRIIYCRYKARQRQNDWSTPQRRQQFFIFAWLAALSLSKTWYYMFAFFAHSYRKWETGCLVAQDVALPQSIVSRLELWLRNTGLFREAWETVIETPARFWWSGQIFQWTTGWSLFLRIMGRRYRIPHIWTYMLLGQIVAISFGQNLFFATVLVSTWPQSPSEAKGHEWTPPLILEVVPVALSLLGTALVPSAAHNRYFILILLIPHLLLFVPAVLRPSRSSGNRDVTTGSRNTRKTGNLVDDGKIAATRRRSTFFKWFLLSCIILQAYSTYSALDDLTQMSLSINSLDNLPKNCEGHSLNIQPQVV